MILSVEALFHYQNETGASLLLPYTLSVNWRVIDCLINTPGVNTSTQPKSLD